MIIKIKKNKISKYSKQILFAIIVSLVLSLLIHNYLKKIPSSKVKINLKISNPLLQIKLNNSISVLKNDYLYIAIFDQKEFQNKIFKVEKYIKNKCKKINLINDIKIYKIEEKNLINSLSINFNYSVKTKIDDYNYVLRCNEIILEYIRDITRVSAIKIIEDFSLKESSLKKIKGDLNIFNEKFIMKDLELTSESYKTFEENIQIINTLGLITSLSTVLSETEDPDLKETIKNNLKINKIFEDLKLLNKPALIDIIYYPVKILKTNIAIKNYNFHKIFLITFVFIILIFFFINNLKKLRFV